MHPLIREAVIITKELGPVTFVGALAVFLHTKNTRESQDLDFAIAKSISREELIKKGYKFISANGKEDTFTPREYKIDIYSDRPLNGISIDTIIDTSQNFPVGTKGDNVNAMGLEALILAKFRAGRVEVDYPDLRALALQRLNDVNEPILRSLAGNDHEVTEIMSTLRFYLT